MKELDKANERLYSHVHQFRHVPILNDAVWVIGCSFVHGHTLKDEQVAAHILQERLQYPVANLGLEGAGPPRMWQTYLALKEYAQPKAVVFAWSGLDRWHFIDEFEQKIIDLGVWKLDPQHPAQTKYPDMMRIYADDLMNKRIESWNKDLIDYAKKTVPQAHHFNIKQIMPNQQFIDIAEDGKHPGPKSHEYIADYLYSILDPAVNK
jgi:hypothetical protein